MKRSKPTLSKLPPAWVTYITSRKIWILLDAYRVELVQLTGNRCGVLEIPERYQFDLASIPRIAWRVIAPFELSIVAPLVHDYLYEHNGVFETTCQRGTFTRKEVDQIFLELMEAEGVSAWRRNVAYRAVRMFGGIGWNRYKRKLI